MMRHLRSLWNTPAAVPAPPKRVWRDWALVALIPVVAVLETLARINEAGIVPMAVVTVAAVPTLLWRRTRPLTMLLSAFVVTEAVRLVNTLLLGNSDVQLYSQVYMLILIYAVFRWGSGRAALLGLALMVGTTAASTLVPPIDLTEVIGSFAIVLLTVTVGLLVRARVQGRSRELDRAKADERAELARDLHDTVAHHVSAIVIRAQAGLATADADPGTAKSALAVIEEEASRSLDEMRTMVQVLRRDDTMELAPTPAVADLQRLASSGDAGPEVTVQVDDEVGALAAPIAAALYRIAQESVTNARRHARHATRIDVQVAAVGERVRLTVHDDGAAVSPGVAGYGLTGMAERAALLGGTCTAGPSPDGGWLVVADLPRKGGAS